MNRNDTLNRQIEEIATVLTYCPENRKLFDIFEGQYLYLKEISDGDQKKYQLLYLILKCMHNPSPEKYSEIADYYLETQGNKFLCFLCDLAALRSNPLDQKTYYRAATFAKVLLEKGGSSTRDENKFIAKNNHEISVIMPTYNRGNIIKESIESVLNQEPKDIELIIINDGGDDLVKSIIDQFDDQRIKYVKISHSGLAGALNAGLLNARGEYISYLDDDDIYYPDHLSTLLNEARKRGKDFVYAKSKIVHGYRDALGGFIPVRMSGTHTLPYSKSTLAHRLGISVLNVLHKRSLAWEAGFFNAEIPWSMDWDFWMRMSDIHEPYFIDKWTGEYRKTLDNMSTSGWCYGVFYMNHLLMPYFTTAYGILTLYRSAYLLDSDDKEIWSDRLSSYFISQEEIFKTLFSTKRLLFDMTFIRKTLLTNNYSHEYSLKKLIAQTLKWVLPKLAGVYNKVLES